MPGAGESGPSGRRIDGGKNGEDWKVDSPRGRRPVPRSSGSGRQVSHPELAGGKTS